MSCNKVYHMTGESAENHADELESTTGARPNVYLCTRCGRYHVGFTKEQASGIRKKYRHKRRRYHNKRKRRKSMAGA